MSKFQKKIHCVKCGDLLSSNFRVYTNSTIYCPECVTLLHLGETREDPEVNQAFQEYLQEIWNSQGLTV